MSASGSEQRISILNELRAALPPQLPAYLTSQRWFGGKARQIRSTELLDIVSFPQNGEEEFFFLFVRVEYAAGRGDTYVLPMRCTRREGRSEDERSGDHALILREGGSTLVLTAALENDGFLLNLLQSINDARVLPGWKGEIRAIPRPELKTLAASARNSLAPKLLRGEQSNSSILYGDKLILKIFRRLEEGMNPDLEMGLFLAEKAHFQNVPAVAGSLDYNAENGKSSTLGILQAFVPNQGDAWRYTLRQLAAFWQDISAGQVGSPPSVDAGLHALKPLPHAPLPTVESYLAAAELLARRTAQMHLALSSDSSDPAFAREPYSAEFQRDLEKSIRALTQQNLGLLREKKKELPDDVRSRAEELISREADILGAISSILGTPIEAARTRIHGDYHLGQVLYTGSDFMIIDFEGEPARPLAERRTKRSPLQDVAGMLRSFHYAAFASWMAPPVEITRPEGTPERLSAWAYAWTAWVSARFFESYIRESRDAAYLPSDRQKLLDLLRLHILEKAIYELGYELNNRPAWAGIPLAGISALLNS